MSGRRRPARRRRADLSQHFLRETRAARLIRFTSISDTDLVIEIGAGRGALTQPLARRCGHLLAVEVDGYLGRKLRQRFGEAADIVIGDFLELPLPGGPYKVVGNVPYGITMAIVRRLVEAPRPPLDAWLIVQRELAHRLCGRPYTTESVLSLQLKPRWHLEVADRLKRTDFDPPPSVGSVLLRLSHRGRPLLSDAEEPPYVELVQAALTHGGSLGQALRPRLSKRQLRRLAADLRFDVDGRPSAVTFEQWLGIFRFLQGYG